MGESSVHSENTVCIAGPNGRALTLADLPSPNTQRWVMRRKAQVVAGVDCGLITLEEACRRYGLTVEEFRSWEYAFQHYGLKGLKVAQVQRRRYESRH